MIYLNAGNYYLLLVVIKIIDPMCGKKLRVVAQPTVGRYDGSCFAYL